MSALIYIIVAILIFGLLVIIHELGHFSIARACGVHIEEFSVGMGPKLFQRKTKKHGTLLSLRALPLGGYVSMKGENGESDDADAFAQKSVWQRIAIVVAGALMNLLLGFLIVLVIVCSSDQLASTTVHSFTEGATSCAEGGLEVGDTIVKVGRVFVYTGEEMSYEIMNQASRPVDLTVVRNGEKTVLHNVVFPNFVEQGTLFGESDFYVRAVESPTLWQLLRISLHRSASLVKMVWDSLLNLLTGRFRLEALSSPIGVTVAVKDVITDSGMTGAEIARYVLHITAVISMNLGVFNLLPLPALDGGRLLFLAFEAVTRKRVSQDIGARIHFVGIVLLMLLSVIIIGKDIISLF